jgi:hypothetical protein
MIVHSLSVSGRVKDVRDLAMLLTGRALLSRASELVSITVDAEPFFIGQDATEALAPGSGGSRTRASRAARSSLGSRLTALPAGRRPGAQELASRSGLTADFSAHSLRVGMAQDEGHETAGIMQAAGWTSPTMLARYTKKLTGKRGVMAKRDAKRHK